MREFRVKKAPVYFGPLVAVAATILLTRCSPVMPSVSKFGGSVVGGGGGTQTQTPVEANPFHFFNYKTHVMGESDYEKALAARAGHAGATTVTLEGDQLDEFVEKRKVTLVHKGKLPPESGHTYFKVKFTRSQIESNGLAEFDTNLKSKDGVHWSLSVDASVPEKTWAVVRENLDKITLVFSREVAKDVADDSDTGQAVER